MYATFQLSDTYSLICTTLPALWWPVPASVAAAETVAASVPEHIVELYSFFSSKIEREREERRGRILRAKAGHGP